MVRPTIETEADFWHDEYPYDWPAEASDRIIARLRAEIEDGEQ